MTIYYFLFFFVCVSGIIASAYQHKIVFSIHGNSNYRISVNETYVFFAFLIITVIVGFRGESVGIDTSRYLRSYTALLNGSSPKIEQIQIVRPFISYICAKLHFPAPLYLLVLSGIMSYFISQYILEMSSDVFMAMIIYIGMFFVQSMNIMDAWLALSFGLGTLTQYNRGNKKKAAFFLVLACLTHISAISMFVFFLFYKLKNKKRAFRIIMLFGVAFIFVADVVMRVIVRIIPRYGSYFYGGRYGRGGVSPEKILLYLIILIGVLIVLHKKRTLLNPEEESQFYAYAAFLVLAIVFSIAASSLLYMNRLVFYFGITIIVSLPAVLNKFPLKPLSKSLVIIAMFYLLYRNKFVDLSGISNYAWFWQ